MLEHTITDPAYATVIDRAVQWATESDDPVHVIIASTWLTGQFDQATAVLADARTEAVGTMLERGFTYGEVAAAVGLSRQRIAQLAKRADR